MSATRPAVLVRLASLALVGLASFASAQTPVGKLVAEVVPQNYRYQTPERILSQVQTRSGRPFSPITAQEDVQRLLATKWFRDVRVETQPADNDTVRVLFVVEEYPNVVREILYRGADHISPTELDTTTGLRRGTPLSPTANQSAAAAILRKYQEDGRVFADVKLVEGGKLGDSRIVFDIIEGPVVKVGGVYFAGNEFAGSDRLRTQLATSRAFLGRIGGTFNPATIDGDISKVTEYYRTLGFHTVRVSRELKYSEDYRNVYITYHLDEGPRYTVKRLQIEGNRTFDEGKLLSLTETKSGEYYDRTVVQADINRIRDFYGFRGQQVAINERVYLDEKTPGEVLVHYEIAEREPARVGRVEIRGNTVTRDNVIRRLVGLYPGQVLTYPDIAVAEANLNRVGIFAGPQEGSEGPKVTVLENDGSSPFNDILVEVGEKPTGSFQLGVGVNSNAGLSGSIVLNERNFDLFRVPTSFEDILAGRAFRGAGQEFRIEAVPGTQFQRYTATFREPSLFDSPYSLTISPYYYNRGFVEYTETRLGSRFSVGRQLTNWWSANVTSRVEQVEVGSLNLYTPESIAEDAGQDFLVGTRVGVTRDTRDSFLRPTTGSSFEAGYEQVVGDHSYGMLTSEFTKFWTTTQREDRSGKHVLSFRSQLSVAGDDTPVYDRFYAGGFRSIRGFEFRGVGPFENGYNTGGTFSFLNSIEYQIPILANDSFYFVSFLDSGTVAQNVSVKDYRVSAGVGIRLSIPALGPAPLALDFGFPIVKGQGDREQLVAFWLGFFN